MKQYRPYVSVFAAIVLVYLTIAILLPPDPATVQRYHISALAIRLLGLSIVIPLLAMWGGAFYGFLMLRGYAIMINKSDDGKGFYYISDGLKWLAFGLPMLSICNSLLNYYGRLHIGFKPTATIIENYLSLFVYALSFIFISRGTAILIHYVHKKSNYGEQHVWVMLQIVMAVLYTYFILKRPIYTNGLQQIYYLSDWLVLLTLAIPYLFLWYTGLRSAYRLHFYTRTVKGFLYRRSLSMLNMGVLFIILSSILLQIVTTLSARIDRLSLAPLLTLLYLLLFVISAGYIMVAIGANRLKRLEEV